MASLGTSSTNRLAWVTLMPKKRRETLVVCMSCHDVIHGQSDELRERAIGEVHCTGRPVAHVARGLGIRKEALRNWVRQAEADAGERDDRLASFEQDELTTPQGECGVEADERDPQGRERFFAAELDLGWVVEKGPRSCGLIPQDARV